MSAADAAAWNGKTVRLTTAEAQSGDNHCEQPAYATRAVAKESYLSGDFRIAPGSLAPLAEFARLTLLEVSCGGNPWVAMGGSLIGIDADHVLAPWDGVFFELTRDRDFRGVGQEPGWLLDIRKGQKIRFAYAYGEQEAVTPAPLAVVEAGTQVIHAVTEANDLHVVIEAKKCEDSMSGKPYEATVTVTLNGQTYRGCGEPRS